MMFEEISEYIRTKKDLPVNWRVYSVELLPSGKIKCLGALTRRVDAEFEPHVGREFDWIKPLTGRSSVTIPRDVYEAEMVKARGQ